MSYSDYGGYAYLNGIHNPGREDYTLIGIQAPADQPLLAATGMKLDVLINAAQQQDQDPSQEETWNKIDWLTGHPHHVVLGDMDVALIGHKQTVTMRFKARDYSEHREDGNYPLIIKTVDPHHVDPAVSVNQLDIHGNIYDPDYSRLDKKWRFGIKAIEYPHSSGMMFYLVQPDGTVESGVIGYGLGDHRWKAPDGRQYKYAGERLVRRGGDTYQMSSSDLIDKDIKKYGLTDENKYDPIGYLDWAPWPTQAKLELWLGRWLRQHKIHWR